MAETGPVCYVNTAANRAPHFHKKNPTNKPTTHQRAAVLDGVASASEEGSQRTRSPGKLDDSWVTLRKPEPRKS